MFTILAMLTSLGCVVAAFLAIWLTGDFWPMRFSGTAFLLFFMSCILWPLALNWSER